MYIMYQKRTSTSKTNNTPVVTSDTLQVGTQSLTSVINALTLQNVSEEAVSTSIQTSLSNMQPLITSLSTVAVGSITTSTAQYVSTPSLSSALSICHKGYVDTSLDNLHTNSNTWASTNTYSNSSLVGNTTPSLVLLNTQTGASLNVIGQVGAGGFNQATQSGDNVICTAGKALSIVPLSTTTVGVRVSDQTVKLQAGSNSITVDSSNNVVVTGPTSYSVNPTVASYVAPATDLTLCPRKYVADQFTSFKSSPNTYSAAQTVSVAFGTNNTTPSLLVSNSTNTTSLNIVSNMGSLAFNNITQSGDTGVISEGAPLVITKHGATSNGIRITDTGVTVTGGTSSLLVDTSGIVHTGASSFNTIPTLTQDLTSSYNLASNMQLANVGLVRSLISSSNPNTSYTWGINTTTYTSSTDTQYPYYLQAPNLGTQTTTNSTGYYVTCYLNAPSGLTGPGNTNVQIQFSYSYTNGLPITGAYSGVSTAALPASGSNLIKRATPFLSTEFSAPNSGMICSQAFFNLMLLPGATTLTTPKLNVNSPTATTAVWTNSTNNLTNYSSNPKVFTNNYSSNAVSMTFNPIQFSVVSQNRIQIKVGFPAQLNSPAVPYWISQASFGLQVVSGYDTASGTGWTVSTA